MWILACFNHCISDEEENAFAQNAFVFQCVDDYVWKWHLIFINAVNADQTTEHLRETVVVPDPADRATIEEEHALELRTRDRERKLLKKVQAASQRIDSGDYGWCEETGEPIGVARLLARPTATLCLDAQLRREIRQKMYGN